MSALKKFIKYYRPYKFLFGLDIFCALIVSAIDLTFPQILDYLTKGVFTKNSTEIIRVLWLVSLGLISMYLIRYVCNYYITSWGHIMGARMESDMRQELFDHYQKLSFSYYDKNNTGEMMSKLISDLFDISELAHHAPENIIISIIKIIGSFILLAMINIPMTLILLAVTVFMGVFSWKKNRKMRAVFTDNRKKIAHVNSKLQDTLSGIRVVQSFANEDIEHEKFCAANRKFLDSKNSSYYIMGKFHAGNSFFQGLLYTAILVSGGFFISRGSIKPTDLAIYALYTGIFLNPINELINLTEAFQRGFSGFRRFLEIVETKPDIVDKKDAKPLKNPRGAIKFNNVSFSYDPKKSPIASEELVNASLEVLTNVSISIEAGKTVALVGPSGGGKTTLCSLLPRFYDVTSGQITIDDIDIRDLTLKSLRQAIGIVQQDVYMFSGSIKENIAYGKPNATDSEIIAAAKKANIHDFIIGLDNGYDTYVGERGTRLSGGQKQRIAIARVFLKNPPILILDEATSALDNESERYVQASLEGLSYNRTTIVIAHRLSTIRNADEIIVISQNGIEERGSHNELISRDGIYAKYYNMQFDGVVNYY